LYQQNKQTMTTTTSIFQIEFCLKGLAFEQRTGMRMSRISARDCAKRILGYTTKQRPSYETLINQMTLLLNKAKGLSENQETAVLVW